MPNKPTIHEQWSSRLIFVLAATGSAVGLGNIWKFPYITGENGGGAFVLVYLMCICLIGIPIMMAEIMLGRRGQQSPIGAMSSLAQESGVSSRWALLGGIGILGGILIMSFYSVIAGWAVSYMMEAALGHFNGLTGETAGAKLGGLLGNPVQLTIWHTIFSVMTAFVVARGVRSGLEKAVQILMPALFVLLIIMVGYAMSTGYFMDGVKFLFAVDFGKLTPEAILTALGHAFFTLSLGMGAIMVYGSYMPKDASIAKTTFAIAILDTLVALLAGMAIFPLVFANGLEAGAGPGLVFVTLPIAFGEMFGGAFFGTIFFMLLVFAAWTSAISLIEPATAWLSESRGMKRSTAAYAVTFVCWALGLVTVMSFSSWSFSFHFAGAEKTDGLFDVLDILTSTFMLPLGGLAIAIFAGWVMKQAYVKDEIRLGHTAFAVWYQVVRWVAPLLLLYLFIHSLGIG